MHATNLKDIRRADAAGRRYDVVVYGDSITAGVRHLPAVTLASFDALFRGGRFAAFGCPGNTVSDLAWRLTAGRERPRLDPRVVVFWIGTNDLGRRQRPEGRLDWLVGWARAAMPASRVVVLALPPRAALDVGPTNARYAALCRRRGALFVECGRGLDPAGPAYIDGLHLRPAGYEVVLRCLVAGVRRAAAVPARSGKTGET